MGWVGHSKGGARIDTLGKSGCAMQGSAGPAIGVPRRGSVGEAHPGSESCCDRETGIVDEPPEPHDPYLEFEPGEGSVLGDREVESHCQRGRRTFKRMNPCCARNLLSGFGSGAGGGFSRHTARSRARRSGPNAHELCRADEAGVRDRRARLPELRREAQADRVPDGRPGRARDPHASWPSLETPSARPGARATCATRHMGDTSVRAHG